MIKAIHLRNFKCFQELHLPLAPLTILSGLNGAGKSSVVQAILLIRQSFESGDLRGGRLLLGGELADLGSGADILYEDASEDVIEIGLDIPDHEGIRELSFTFAYDRDADHLVAVEASQSFFNQPLPLDPPFHGDFTFLSADRVGPRKALPLSETRSRKRDVGSKGEYALHVLLSEGRRQLSESDPRILPAQSTKLADLVDAWLSDISPGSHVDAEMIRAADIALAGFHFDRTGDVPSARFRATNVGFGLSYALSVLVSLLVAEPGGIVLIENPEAHLHPRGQTRIGQLAARASLAGVQVILETHSDHVIDGIRISVRDGVVKPDDVRFHFFKRLGISARVESPAIDSDGRLDVWPDGFFDQRDENLAKLLSPKPR
jgi:predicted ATPase